jgi:hypothetical protein
MVTIATRALRGDAIRRAFRDGVEYLVVPVVALVEGVLHAVNAPSPELALATEFGQRVDAWIGRPVTTDHPTRDGQQVSASDPSARALIVGRVGRAEAIDGRLELEVLIDVPRAERSVHGRDLLARLRTGSSPVEASVGVFVRAEPRPGSFRGKAYGSVWRDIRADHIALLPNGHVGACSTEMGCGVLVGQRVAACSPVDVECPHCRAALARQLGAPLSDPAERHDRCVPSPRAAALDEAIREHRRRGRETDDERLRRLRAIMRAPDPPTQ